MNAFDKIRAGLEEAIEYANGDETKGRKTIISRNAVRAIRAKTGLSQDKFAKAFGVSASTLRKWEQGQRKPDGPAGQLLKLIDFDPKHAMKVLGKVA